MPAHDPAGHSGPHPPWRIIIDACAFGLEITMMVLLGVIGARIGSTVAVRVILAALFPVAAIGFWAIWLAPASRHRLGDPWRLFAQIVLFVITAALAAAAHLLIWGVTFAVTAIVIFSLTRLPPSRHGPSAAG